MGTVCIAGSQMTRVLTLSQVLTYLRLRLALHEITLPSLSQISFASCSAPTPAPVRISPSFSIRRLRGSGVVRWLPALRHRSATTGYTCSGLGFAHRLLWSLSLGMNVSPQTRPAKVPSFQYTYLLLSPGVVVVWEAMLDVDMKQEMMWVDWCRGIGRSVRVRWKKRIGAR